MKLYEYKIQTNNIININIIYIDRINEAKYFEKLFVNP